MTVPYILVINCNLFLPQAVATQTGKAGSCGAACLVSHNGSDAVSQTTAAARRRERQPRVPLCGVRQASQDADHGAKILAVAAPKPVSSPPLRGGCAAHPDGGRFPALAGTKREPGATPGQTRYCKPPLAPSQRRRSTQPLPRFGARRRNAEGKSGDLPSAG